MEARPYYEESKVAQEMEERYQRSGRSDPKHPLHGLFTGLFSEAVISSEERASAKP